MSHFIVFLVSFLYILVEFLQINEGMNMEEPLGVLDLETCQIIQTKQLCGMLYFLTIYIK